MKCIWILIISYMILLNGNVTNAICWDVIFGSVDPTDECIRPKICDIIQQGINQLQHILTEIIPKKHIKFILFTRRNPRHGIRIRPNVGSIRKSTFNSKHPVRIIIHGHSYSSKICSIAQIRKAYLKKGDFNVINVDWSMISRVRGKTMGLIADKINKLTKILNTEFLVNYRNIYLIGHDVGAHIAGLAGRRLGVDQYDTIFGLDPASRSRYSFKEEDMLQAYDAFYVESIHTNMGQLGVNKPVGFSSIFPDFGKRQSLCKKSRKFCNHKASVMYFVKSINWPQCFKVKRCNTFEDILQKKCPCSGSEDCNKVYRLGGEPSEKKFGIFYASVPCKKVHIHINGQIIIDIKTPIVIKG